MSDNPEFLTASEAVKYLAERWGIEEYSLEAFRALRFRLHIKPAFGSNNSTFWRKSDLDNIEKPDRSKPRGPRKKNASSDALEEVSEGTYEGDDSSTPSVRHIVSTLASLLARTAHANSETSGKRELAEVG